MIEFLCGRCVIIMLKKFFYSVFYMIVKVILRVFVKMVVVVFMCVFYDNVKVCDEWLEIIL